MMIVKERLTHMTAPKKNEYRDPNNGQYAYFGGFERMCVCGHTLGVHIAGGFECGADPFGKDENGFSEPDSANCKCLKFRPSRRKADKR